MVGMGKRIIRWTTCDLLEGKSVDLNVDDSWTLWEEREIAAENVRQGIVDGYPRRLIRVELMVTKTTEEKV